MTVDLQELCPGIREAVRFLQMEGFETIDSGDGSLAKAGMECAFDEPMVGIKVEPHSLIVDSHRLRSILLANQINANIEASYNPDDEVAVIVVFGPDLINLGVK